MKNHWFRWERSIRPQKYFNEVPIHLQYSVFKPEQMVVLTSDMDPVVTENIYMIDPFLFVTDLTLVEWSKARLPIYVFYRSDLDFF